MKKRIKNSKGITKLVKALVAPPKKLKVKKKVLIKPPQRVLSNLNSNDVYNRFLAEKQRLLEYQQLKETELSPRTQRELAIIAAIQNKSKTDDAKRQRIRREREILQKSMSILNTPFIFKGNEINPTNEIMETNPLRAPNVFTEREDNPHILKQVRPSILQTNETGNTLHLF